MKKTELIARSLSSFILALLMFVLAGCSAGRAKQNEEYVSNVKQLVDNAVMATRTLNEQEKSFDYSDEKLSKAYLSTLDTLAGLYDQILELNATEDFRDLDKTLADESTTALSDITQIKALASYAYEKNDPTLYQKDNGRLMNDYKTHYEKIKELSSEIQTRWRNA